MCWPKALLGESFSLTASRLHLQVHSKQWTAHCHRSLTQAIFSPSSQYSQIDSSIKQRVSENIIVNIILTSAFITSGIDVLIHCFLTLKNMQLKDVPRMQISTRISIATHFFLVSKILNLLSKILQFNFTIPLCCRSPALLTRSHCGF